MKYVKINEKRTIMALPWEIWIFWRDGRGIPISWLDKWLAEGRRKRYFEWTEAVNILMHGSIRGVLVKLILQPT